MIVKLNGYQIIQQLYESSNSLVYRGIEKRSDRPVILKFLKQEYPTREELTRYKQEYEITKHLKIQNAIAQQDFTIAAYDLKQYQNTFVIIFEDFGGYSLDVLIKKHSFTIQEFLQIAIKINLGLSVIHEANIIHKDINPSNIVYNPITKELKIIDFGISTILPRENPKLQNPNVLEGTLAYISPEQTGRINRSLDYRSDFYSLGITLYELLTNKKPFLQENLLELLYCHLAKNPVAPHQYHPRIPRILSEIILKLIDKNPEQRYQSNWGIQKDLECCWQQLEAKGRIENFELASQDIYKHFQISQKLYGREKEIEILLRKFNSICDRENKTGSIVLISGYSGIGKSKLIGEIYKPITEAKGYFIKGKFEQYQNNIPYIAFLRAFEELVDYLLVEPEETLKKWRAKILKVLGNNAGAIINLIPKLELILGKQPEVSTLPAKQAENRFNLLFQKFIQVFCQKEHPLTIFLDDLQWIDSGSLNLIQLIVTNKDIEYLFLVGAYRDNEVSRIHPLNLALNEIELTGAIVDRISLKPLKLSHVTQLIEDSFNCKQNRAKPLAELVLAKTEGNPFFINKFLQSLYQENLLYFDSKQRMWQWDLTEIKAKNITENVVKLLSLEIKKLKEKSQQILQLAACIGNQFDIQILAIVSGNNLQTTAFLLQEAMVTGLIYPLSDAYRAIELDLSDCIGELKVEYKFVHDRIQQAAYSLIPENEKALTHFKIGKLLLKYIAPERQKEKIFEIVNHLNLGRKLITQQKERYQLAKLNAIAGEKAKGSSAFGAAYHYFSIGLELLDPNCWSNEYDLSLTLHTATAEAAYLKGNFTRQVELVESILQKGRSRLEKVKAYEIELLAKAGQNQPLEAIETALEILRFLGLNFPNQPSKLRILLALIHSKLILFGKSPEEIMNFPVMTDPEKLAAMQIMGSIGPSVYSAFPSLSPLLVIKAVNLSVKHGNTSMSAYGYACYGLILCGVLGDINTGYRFGQIALNLVEQSRNQEFKARTLVIFNNFVRHWKEHLNTSLAPLLEAHSTALENGDLQFAASSIYMYCYRCYFIGEDLNQLARKMFDYINLISKLRQETILDLVKLYHQAVLNLLEEPQNPGELIGDRFDESEMLTKSIETNHQSSIFYVYFNKFILYYLFEDYDRALENVNLARPYLDSVRATFCVPVFYFYDSLVQLQKYNSVERSQQQKIFKSVNYNQRKIKKWARYAPVNYLNKYYLVAAEQDRILGKKCEASENYDRAIALAKENKFIQEEALANELAGKFYLALGKDKISQVYLKDAFYCYQKWGAKTKVKALEAKYPQLFDLDTQKTTKKVSDTSKTTSNKITSEDIDLATLIKTSRALSQETNLEKLLEIVLKFTVENVGAQTGLLILDKGEEIFLEARVTSEPKIFPLVSNISSLKNSDRCPISVIRYVQITKETVVLNNASQSGIFIKDRYIVNNKIKSILCMPLLSQGKLIGVIYLENNLSIGAFNEERLEILKLISSQAAIALENTLLRNKKSKELYQYQVGGCLTPDAPSYVVRQADRDLYTALKKGNFCYIFNARQMGKSSLRIQIMNQLHSEGFTCVAVDLTTIGSKNITLDRWYGSFIYKLASNLKLLDKFNFRAWWSELDFLSPMEKLREFIDQILLEELSEKIVIFIDEIDSVLSLNFDTDDFFALIRSFYNYRAESLKYQRLNFVLIGVTTPSKLIQEHHLTPFNIGQPIPLQNFKPHEVSPLVAGLINVRGNPRNLIENVLLWTGGQPFLTQKICNLIISSDLTVELGKEAEFVTELVREKVINNWQLNDDPEHLKTISNRLLQNKNYSAKLLIIYEEIWQGKEIIFNDTPEIQELLLSGLISVCDGKLRVSNQIYASVFNRNWIANNLPNSDF